MKNVLVSVVVITYNQRSTILQTLESIINQQSDFCFEIIIGEDCSTDETRELCICFQQKHHEITKLILQENNKGIIRNYADCMNACEGKYIAQCSGDDYWCDNYKLQKQIDFLENNKEYGFVRTGGYSLNTKTNKMSVMGFHDDSVGDVFDKAIYGPVGLACSICFERDLLKYIDFDEFILRKFSMEDYPMHAIFSKHTRFGFIPDLCVVYRISNGSASNPQDRDLKLNYYIGYSAVKLYLAELFPDDVIWNDEMARNFILHKRLKFAFEKFDYLGAKEIALQLINPNKKEQKLVLYTKNALIFYIGCFVKKIM